MNEPVLVYPEERFEDALAQLAETILGESNQRHTIVRHFGLDVAVFFHAGRSVFMEAKAYNQQRQGGVGFGNAKGLGSQVELLLLEEAELRGLESSVRWAYVDATVEPGERRYGLFSGVEMKRAAMGGVARNKQNNLRVAALTPHLVDWRTFCAALQQFLLPDTAAHRLAADAGWCDPQSARVNADRSPDLGSQDEP